MFKWLRDMFHVKHSNSSEIGGSGGPSGRDERRGGSGAKVSSNRYSGFNAPGRVDDYRRTRAGSDDLTDPLSPFNPLSPLNPLSPFNPSSPFYSPSQPAESTHHDSLAPAPESHSHHDYGSPDSYAGGAPNTFDSGGGSSGGDSGSSSSFDSGGGSSGGDSGSSASFDSGGGGL